METIKPSFICQLSSKSTRDLKTKLGIAKLTFRHDRNTIIHGSNLPLPSSKTQKPYVSNPDNCLLIPDVDQVDWPRHNPQPPKAPILSRIPDKNHQVSHSPAQRHPNVPRKTQRTQRLMKNCQKWPKTAHSAARVRAMGVVRGGPKSPQSGQLCVRVGCSRCRESPPGAAPGVVGVCCGVPNLPNYVFWVASFYLLVFLSRGHRSCMEEYLIFCVVVP